jgi:DNA ligase-1
VRSFKLKRDYLAGQVDSFDLVPVGAYWGKGKRAGRYGAFLLACRAEEAGGEALQTVCKLGSGFSDADVDGLAAWFAANGLVRDSPAPELDLGAMAKGRQPDVWLEPAAVWEVLAAEISESPTYSAARAPGGRGLALRFPRFVRARDDKRVRDASVGAQIMSAYAAQLALSPGTPGPPELALSPVD